MNIRMHLDITAETEAEAGSVMSKLAAAFGGQALAITASAPAAPTSDAGSDALDDTGDERPTASRKTYCHDKANKALYVLEKGDTLPSPESGVETISKASFEKLEAEYTPSGAEAAGTDGDDGLDGEVSFVELKVALQGLSSSKGAVLAKSIIQKVGGVEKLSAIPEEKWPAVMAAVDAAAGDADDEL